MLENLVFIDFYQIILTLTILILGLCICLLLGVRKSKDLPVISVIYLWHSFFSFYYWYFTLTNTADAVGYFKSSFTWSINLAPGTSFTNSLTYIITRLLNSNYLNTTLVFNIFGSLGIIYLYLSLKKFTPSSSSLWLLILFIPSMSFWSAGIGKDSIAFLAVCLFLYAIVESNRLSFLVAFSFFMMFMVRPHVAAMILISYVIYFIFNSRAHLVLKVFSLPIIAFGLYLILNFAQQYVGLENATVASLGSYVDQRQSYNLEGGSSLDIASMSYPMQMFTYIFRPLPFEANSLLSLITSLENTIILFLFIYVLLKSRFNLWVFVEGKNLWLFIYIFLTCTILAITTANLGIATRQKWMFMPVLIYLIIYSFYKNKNGKNKKL